MHKIYPSLLDTIALAAILLVAAQTSAQTLLWDMLTAGRDIDGIEDHWEQPHADTRLAQKQ